MGGGNGLATLLRGLKRYARAAQGALEITAVVTVTDDGGSSGRLRREFDVLPPGDIRNCMIALCADESLLTRLFNYRFSAGRGLKGHSFGNLFLMAMTHLTGDFSHAVRLSSEVLAVSGRIYPSTRADVSLAALLADGTRVKGETRISRSAARIERVTLEPARRAKPLSETLEAIAQADLITLGPGSLFTSVIPNLLVDGIPRAIAKSTAAKAYFMNLMTQPGETTGFRASDHLVALRAHAGRWADGLIDVCVVNSRSFTGRLVEQYGAQQARPVEIDAENLGALGIRVVRADLVRANLPGGARRAPNKIRHDPGSLGAIAMELAVGSGFQDHRRLSDGVLSGDAVPKRRKRA
jgi:uncharacterized cofD-like protein